MKKKGESSVVLITLWVATFVTLLIFLVFGYFFVVRNVFEQELNAIGDSFAGPASLLAFVWLLTTVIIQNSEMASLKGAAETQASSLEVSAKINLLTHLRAMQQDYEPRLQEINRSNISELEVFFRAYGFQDAVGLSEHPDAGIPWLIGYFLQNGAEFTEFKMGVLSIENVRPDFKYDVFVVLDGIKESMRQVAGALNIMREFSIQANTMYDQIAWESALRLDWYEKHCDLVENVRSRCVEVILKGGIAPDTVTLIMQMYSERPIEKIKWVRILPIGTQ